MDIGLETLSETIDKSGKEQAIKDKDQILKLYNSGELEHYNAIEKLFNLAIDYCLIPEYCSFTDC